MTKPKPKKLVAYGWVAKYENGNVWAVSLIRTELIKLIKEYGLNDNFKIARVKITEI